MVIVEPARRIARQMTVEGVDEESKRQVPLELSGAPREYQMAAFLCACREFRKQARLADPRFASQSDRARRAALDR